MSDFDLLSGAVADLAARVEQLEHQAAPESDDHRLDNRLLVIENVLAKLQAEFGDLANQRAAEVRRQPRLPWDKLTVKQAEQRWNELRSWVDQLIIRNGIGPKEIPNCWYLHDGLVDELEALRWASIEANRPKASGAETLRWREALHRARARWPAFNPNGCAVEHSATRTRGLASEAEWRAFLAEKLCTYTPGQPARAS